MTTEYQKSLNNSYSTSEYDTQQNVDSDIPTLTDEYVGPDENDINYEFFLAGGFYD